MRKQIHTIVQICIIVEHFVYLQDDCANLHNRLEYFVDLQDDCANLHNHLDIL